MPTHVFQAGETVLVSVSVTDSDGDAHSPSSGVTIAVADPAGTSVLDATAMTAGATGAYTYYHSIAADATEGEYTITLTATDGSYVTELNFIFYVEG